MANDRIRNMIKASLLWSRSKYTDFYTVKIPGSKCAVEVIFAHDDDLPDLKKKYGSNLKDFLGNDLEK